MSLFLKNKMILFNIPNSLFIKCELSRKIHDKTVRFSTVFTFCLFMALCLWFKLLICSVLLLRPHCWNL